MVRATAITITTARKRRSKFGEDAWVIILMVENNILCAGS